MPPELASVAMQAQAGAQEPIEVRAQAGVQAWVEAQESAAEQEQRARGLAQGCRLVAAQAATALLLVELSRVAACPAAELVSAS